VDGEAAADVLAAAGGIAPRWNPPNLTTAASCAPKMAAPRTAARRPRQRAGSAAKNIGQILSVFGILSGFFLYLP